jgi:hypothetical protein
VEKLSEQQNLKMIEPQLTSMSMMKQLANNDEDLRIDISGEMLIDRTKLFLVAQARNSLQRIIKLTAFLEKLEDKFIEAVSTRLDEDTNDVTMIALSMETISKLLQDANNTVMQVLRDEKLQSIVINTTNIITPDGNSATVIDADSRDAVRNMAANLLSQLSKLSDDSDTIEADIVDKD